MLNRLSPSNKIHVFVASYPFDVLSAYLPCARQREIDECLNDDVKNSKYYAFKLLEIALKSVYGADMRDCNVVRNDRGKWTCDVCNFSLSHCGDVVAVAVSDAPVGVDVERINASRFEDKLQRRIFTENERETASAMTDAERCDFANRIWTVKEAQFKRSGGKVFVANQIEASLAESETKRLSSNNREYYLSVVFDGLCSVSYKTTNVFFVE